MDLATFFQQISAPPLAERIAHRADLPAQPAQYQALQPALAPALAARLDQLGITQLYTHQAQAVTLARAGAHVGIVTSTASGKTLCYHLPTLERLLVDPRNRALYLFPTKALAQDQLRALQELAHGLPHVRAAVYDGDTPAAQRAAVRASANIVLTNPDMLHLAVLPNHQSWRRFLGSLAVIVLDEAHVYRGIFGSHVALVLRRLRRICTLYGARPQFVLASATIGNPQQHLEALIGDEIALVDQDGAPHGPRTLIFWNPPLLSASSGARRSANTESALLFSALLGAGVRTLVFAKARKVAELLLRYTRQQLGPDGPPIAAYRAGYRAEDRRDIEGRLASGALQGVVSTTALELGVDIGGLDAVISTGYPGTVASTWQQFGRAGRAQAPSVGVLVALEDPLDQYWMQHPAEFFARPHEQACITLENPYVLGDQLRCAAYEQPLRDDELLRWFGPAALPLANAMIASGEVVLRGDRIFAPPGSYPAETVAIRAVGHAVVELRDERGQLIERIPAERAPGEVHPGAVYLHQGASYLVTSLDLARHTATAQASEVSYYTQPRDQTELQIVAVRATKAAGATAVTWGDVQVRRQVVGYRRKALFHETVLADYALELPAHEFTTQAVWWTLPAPMAAALRAAGADLAGGLHAAEHAMIALLPLLAMCDRWDIGGLSTAWSPETGAATVFIYDGVPGGVGISELGFQYIADWWQITANLLRDCPCAEGCPSCVQSPKCGNGNQPLDKAVALQILEAVLGGEVPWVLELG